MNSRTLLLIGLGSLFLVGTLVWFIAQPSGEADGANLPTASVPNPAPVAGEPSRPAPLGGPEAGLVPDGVDPTNGITLSEDLWPDVDWDAIRERTPHSLVWTDTMPPDTDAERARRAQMARDENEQFGQIQAGLADDAAIDAYFDHKERLLTDNLEFVGILLADHRSAIPERDQGLLEMAFSMTYKRLQQLPGERDRAFDWKADHEARRAANP